MNIDDLREELFTYGSAMFEGPDGKRLFLVSGSILTFVDNMATPSILAAMEGEGAYLWDIRTDMNPFVLISAGFSLKSAPTLSGVLLALVRASGEGPQGPLLEGPKGP